MELEPIHFKIPSKEEIAKRIAEAKAAAQEAEKLFVNSPSNIQAQERRDEAKASDDANKETRDRLGKQGDWEIAQAEFVASEKKRINEQASNDNAEIDAIYAERNLQMAAERKAVYGSMLQDLQQFGQQALQSMGSFIQASIANASKFGTAMAQLSAKQELIREGANEANITAADIEKQVAKDRAATFLKMTSDMLAQIAIQAGIKAILEAGEAVASAAGGNYPGAALHATAAGIYAGVAIAAGGTAAAISATRPMTSEEQQQLATAEGNGKDKAGSTKGVGDTAANDNVQTVEKGVQVNVYNLGITGQTKEAQGAALADIQKQYSDLGTGTR